MQLYTEYIKAWEALLEDCKKAKKHIYLEQFILRSLDNNEIGQKVLEVLEERSRAGVEVKIILDAGGSRPLFLNLRKQKEIAGAGIELQFFGIVPRWKAYFPFNMFHRDHRKIVIIDNEIAHVGGVIIQESAKDWQDINIRIDDPMYVRELTGAFLRMWDELKGRKDYKEQYDKDNGKVLKTEPDNNQLYNEILLRIQKAKHRIVIISPYISPHKEMLNALEAAQRRGVKVSFIIPEEGDAWISRVVNLSYMPELYRSGIHIHSYCQCMNHGKLVAIDEWVTVGSMNFDRLSFFHNRELNIVFNEGSRELEQLLENTQNHCRDVNDDFFKKQSRVDKFYSFIGRMFRTVA